MDHLPVPRNPAQWSVKVPYICKTPYDQGDFLTYPERAGPQWRHVLPREGKSPFFVHELNSPSNREDLEAFLQCWIFFGLLCEVLAPFGLYDESEYHEDDGGKENVHTHQLAGRIDAWRVRSATLSDIDKEKRKRRLVECLVLSLQTLQVFLLDPDGAPRIRTQLGPDARLRNSLLGLCTTVGRLGELTFQVLPELDWPEFNLRPGFSEEEKRFLIQQKWCPSAVAREDAALAPVLMRHYMMHMQQPATTLDHAGCTEDGCTTVQIDDKSYTPAHWHVGCECDLIGPDEAKVAICLESGTFPVFEITGQSIDDVQLTIRPYSDNVTYVALSHIWADGLGNPKETSIRKCQLLRLKRLVNDLQLYVSTVNGESQDGPQTAQRLYTWCDTLLCPIQISDPPEEMTDAEREAFRQQPHVAKSRKLKQLALAKMRDVYTKAAYVLVLDHELQAVHYSTMNDIEALVRIVTSRWMQRVWTFQEAVLADGIFFQFADRVADLRKLNVSVKASYNDSPTLRALSAHALSRSVAIRPFQYLMEQGGMNIVFFQVAVRNRLVKYEEDEPLVSATVLGLDAELVARADTLEQRMMIFWKLLSEKANTIPASICFNTCDRIDQPGYRWAPLTLRRPHARVSEHFFANDDDINVGKLTDHGLQVALTGWRVNTGSAPYGVYNMAIKKLDQIGTLLYVRTAKGKWFTISERSSQKGTDEHVTPWYVIASDLSKDWRIILDDRARYDGKGRQGLLGFMETPSGATFEVFRSCYIVDIAEAEAHYGTIVDAAKGHADALVRLPCFKRLQLYVAIDLFLGWLARPLPSILQKAIGSLTSLTITRLVNWDMSKFVEQLKIRNSIAGQTNEKAKEAMWALGGRKEGGESIVGYIMMHFFGKVLNVQETFDDQHLWIVD